MKSKNTNDKNNNKTFIHCIGMCITSMAILVLIAMLVMTIIGIHAKNNEEQEIAYVPENEILGATGIVLDDVGDSVKATFDGDTGILTIASVDENGETVTPSEDSETPEIIGTLNKQQLSEFFDECGRDNILQITIPNRIKAPTDLSYLFNKLHNMATIQGAWYLDTSIVTNMSYMFSDCESLTFIGLDNWNMTNVTTTEGILNRCISLDSLDTPNACPAQPIILPTEFYKESDETAQAREGYEELGGAKATFDDGTGTLKIYNRFTVYSEIRTDLFPESTRLKVATLDGESLKDLYYEKGEENIHVIDFENKIYAPQSEESLFANLPQLTTVNNAGNLDVSDTENLYKWFENCPNLTTIDVSNWDTEKVRLMSALFSGCTNLATIDISKWDTSSCEKMEEMFMNCSSLTTIAVDSLEMNTVTAVRKMFSGCTNLQTIDVSNWDTQNIVNMCALFENCENLQSIEVGSWDMQNAQDISYMFYGCKKLTTINVGSWNTQSAVNLDRTFMNCEKLATLDVSKLKTDNVQNMEATFYNCGMLSELDVSGWKTGSVTNMYATFGYCDNLTTLNVSQWDTSKVEDMHEMFYKCTNLSELDVSHWQTGEVKNISSMFVECTSISTLNVSQWDTKNVTDMHSTFYEVSNVPELDVSGWDTSRVEDMHEMFYHCDLITELSVSNWKTGEVKNMTEMFYNCKKLQTLDVSQWDTSKVTNMSKMFYHCDVLAELNVSDWKTSAVTNMKQMFYSLSTLTTLDVSGWNTENVTDMGEMFYKCTHVTELDVSNWDTHLVTNMYRLFYRCEKITELNMSNWDMNLVTNTDSTEEMLYNCKKLTDIYTPKTYSTQTIVLPNEEVQRWYNVDDVNDDTIYTEFINDTFDESVHLTILIDYNISYELGSGTISPEKTNPNTYNAFSNIKLNNPELERYTFTGWTEGEEVEGQEPVLVVEIDGRQKTGDLKYTAHYRMNAFTLTINPNEGSYNGQTENSTEQLTSEETKTLEEPTRLGYEFGGWDISGAGAEAGSVIKGNEFTMGQGDTILTAKWTPRNDTKYTVKHWKQRLEGKVSPEDDTNYEMVEEETTLKGTTDAMITPATKEYPGFTAPTGKEIKIEADGTAEVNYYYTRNSYQVTVTQGTGIQSTSIEGSVTTEGVEHTYLYEEQVTVSATLLADTDEFDYEWSNWTSEDVDDSDQQIYTFKMPAKAVTLKANGTQTKKKYMQIVKVQYEKADGTFEDYKDEVNAEYEYGAQVTWSIKETPIYEAKSIEPYNVTGVQTTEVTVNRKKYTLTLNQGEGISTVNGAGEHRAEELVNISAEVSKGYTWDKWARADGEEGEDVEEQNHQLKMETKNVTFTAQATLDTYTIQYNLNGEDVQDPNNQTTYTVKSEEITLKNPTREGYNFTGWTEEGNEEKKLTVTIPQGSTGDRKFTANWEPKGDTAYKVKHWKQRLTGQADQKNEDNYEMFKEEQLNGTTGQSVTPPVTSIDGFTAPTPEAVEIKSDGTAVVNYYYTRNRYQITVTSGTGIQSTSIQGNVTSEPHEEGYLYEEQVTISAQTSNGYTWQKWTDTQSQADITTDNRYQFEMVSKDLDYTANATINTYTIEYVLGGGQVEEPGNPNEYTVESADITLKNPTKQGYNFTGWTEEGKEGIQENVTISHGSTGNKTFTANWEANGNTQYNIYHYKQNTLLNGYDEPDIEPKQGQTDTQAVAVPREYEGFEENKEHTDRQDSGTITGDGKLILKLYYDRKTYKVTLDTNDGIINDEDVTEYTYGIEKELPTDVTKEGYTFGGWYADEECEGEMVTSIPPTETEDKTYYAKWIANEASVIVHHYIYDEEEGQTSTSISDDVEIPGEVGKEYTANVATDIPSNYTCKNPQPTGYTGYMTKDKIEVTFYYELIKPTLKGNVEVNVSANKVEEDGTPILTREDGIVTYDINYNLEVKDYIGNAKVEIEVQLPSAIDTDKSELDNGIYTESSLTIKWVEVIDDIDTFTKKPNGTYTKQISKHIQIVYDGQDVTEGLVSKVNGKITTYYPEDYLTKGGEVLNEKVSDKTITVNQDYKANLKVEKVWDDREDKRQKRPESVTMEITSTANGEVVEVVLNEGNSWTYEQTELPKYTTAGDKIEYTITEKETNEGELQYYDEANIQKTETQTDETTNYAYIVTNSYKLKETEFKTAISKVGPDEIISKEEKVNYTINFTSEISNYIGTGKITIVDTLPFPIDEENSVLDGGQYDEETNTITWAYELLEFNTNTGENRNTPDVGTIVDNAEGKVFAINVTKQIQLTYKSIDLAQEKMTNEVKGKVELDSEDEMDVESTGSDTNLNVKGNVVVKYIDVDTNEEIINKETNKSYTYKITDKIGRVYVTDKKEIEGYEYVETLGDNIGIVKEKDQEVIYYYKKIPKITITVKYIDIETEEDIVATSITNPDGETYNYKIVGNIGEEYEAEQKYIPYYTFVKSTANVKGKLKEDDTVIYYYRKLIFNFSVNKTLAGVTLNGKGLDIKDNKLTKIELKPQEVNNVEIIVDYIIKVTNTGELAGTIRVLDKIPEGFEVVDLPEYWKQNEDGTIETSLELGSGSNRDLILKIRWINSEENLGFISNAVELTDGDNMAKYGDINKDDDTSDAAIVISLKTGLEVNTTIIVMTIISMIITVSLMIILIHTFRKGSDIKEIKFLNK